LPYKIVIHDLFHFMDEDEEYELAERYDTAATAIAEAKRRLDRELLHMHRPGMTGQELYEQWSAFGEMPLILRTDHAQLQVAFSSFSYVRERAVTLVETAAERQTWWQQWLPELGNGGGG
jgi:hypothetical protein